MTMDQTIAVLAFVTLAEMMVYIGLSTSVADFLSAATDRRLVARALLANYVLVPAATVVLLVLFRAPPMVAVGFLILAVCPGGPYGPPCTAIAKGNTAAAAGLMVVLVGSSAILSPLLLRVTVRPLTGDRPINIDVARIMITLLTGQVLPLLAGLALNRWRPGTAATLVVPARYGAKILNAALLTLVLVAQYKILLQIKPLAWLGMLTLLIATLIIGWACGSAKAGGRKAMALTTAVRNKGVGMVIATGAFAGTPAVTATMIYGLSSFLGALLVAFWWARRDTEPQSPAPPIAPMTVGTGS